MSYSTDRMTSVRLDCSPSLQFNNLSISGGDSPYIAYTHKQEICIMSASGLESRDHASPSRLQIATDGPEVKCALCTVKHTYLLALVFNGIQFWDATGNELLLIHTFGDSEPSASPSTAAAAAADLPGGAGGDSDSKTAAGEQFLGCIRANCAVAVPETGNILVGTSSGCIAVFNCTDKGVSYCHSVSAHSSPVACLAISGTVAVSVDEAGNACTWDVSTMNTKRVFSLDGEYCTGVAIVSDNIVAALASGMVHVYDMAEGKLTAQLAGHARCINGISAHPNKPMFATCGEDGVANVWALQPSGGVGGTASPKAAKLQASLVHTCTVTDHTLTGVHFLLDAPHHLVLASFDIFHLRVLLTV